MGIRDEREKVKVRKEKLGGYFFSLSQLTFTGTGVGGFLPLLKGEATVGDVSVLIFGVLATAVFAGIANKILKYWLYELFSIIFSDLLYRRWKFLAWLYTKPGEKWLKDL